RHHTSLAVAAQPAETTSGSSRGGLAAVLGVGALGAGASCSGASRGDPRRRGVRQRRGRAGRASELRRSVGSGWQQGLATSDRGGGAHRSSTEDAQPCIGGNRILASSTKLVLTVRLMPEPPFDRNISFAPSDVVEREISVVVCDYQS
ncbi:hypothetical protein EJB05_05295, partial [Eragrostis curvula]